MCCNTLSPTATKNGPVTAEFPAKSGILIQEVINTSGGRVFGGSFEVLIPAKGRERQRRQDKKALQKMEDAKRLEKGQYKGLSSRGSAFFCLNTQLQDGVKRTSRLAMGRTSTSSRQVMSRLLKRKP